MVYPSLLKSSDMAKSNRLVNEFSWSFSRQSTFHECKKKYWYIYYGSWEGWPKTPWDSRPSVDPLASYLYALKNMQRLPLFLGSCVHETIEHFLKELMKGERKPLQLDAMITHALHLFTKGLESSQSGKWRESPKKYANLFEHYYQEPIDKTSLEEAKEKITTCITNWSTSAITKMIFDPRAQWRSIEEMGTFQLANSYKIIVVVDFALQWKTADGDVSILFDWKTGQKSQKTDEQLYCYALFAHKAWNVPYDKILLSPFYLFSNEYTKIGYQQKETLSLSKLAEVEDSIVSSCHEMSQPLADLPVFPGSPPPDPTLFPYAENRWQCNGCSFKELCHKADYAPVDIDQMRELVKELS